MYTMSYKQSLYIYTFICICLYVYNIQSLQTETATSKLNGMHHLGLRHFSCFILSLALVLNFTEHQSEALSSKVEITIVSRHHACVSAILISENNF